MKVVYNKVHGMTLIGMLTAYIVIYIVLQELSSAGSGALTCQWLEVFGKLASWLP